MDTTRNTDMAAQPDFSQDPDFSNMYGVFREREKAEQAIEVLKQAGIGDDQPQLMVYDPHAGEEHAEEEEADSTRFESLKRFIVQVRAEGREQDAVGVMVGCGANNADLPPGTALVHGSIINETDANAEHAPTNAPAESRSDSLLGGAKAPGHPGDTSMMDNSNAPHG